VKIRVIGILLTLTLVGCETPGVWYKPHASHEDFAQVKYECMEHSQSSMSYANAYGGGSVPTINMPVFRACMEAHGWVYTTQQQVDKVEGLTR
jgi:hypothetical protein